MKRFKQIDLGISIVLILASIILYPLYFDDTLDAIIASYYTVGGWQAFSMIIHTLCRWFTKQKSERLIYHWVSFISVLSMPLTIGILFFAAPSMAIYYCWLCYREISYLNKYQLIQLK